MHLVPFAPQTAFLAATNRCILLSLYQAAWDSATVAFKAFLAASMAWFATSTASLTAFFAASIWSLHPCQTYPQPFYRNGSTTIPAASGLFKSSTTPSCRLSVVQHTLCISHCLIVCILRLLQIRRRSILIFSNLLQVSKGILRGFIIRNVCGTRCFISR